MLCLGNVRLTEAQEPKPLGVQQRCQVAPVGNLQPMLIA